MQDALSDEVGPFCVGTRERHSRVTPAAFARQLDELQWRADTRWWQSVVATLTAAATKGHGRLHPDLCAELAHALDSGLKGVLPASFAKAAGVDTSKHFRAPIGRELRARAYVLAAKYNYFVERSPVASIIKRININQRTWHRWNGLFSNEEVDQFLHMTLASTGAMFDLSRPWVKLSIIVSLGLQTSSETRQLHMERGGRIVTDERSEEVWIMGGHTPDIESSQMSP